MYFHESTHNHKTMKKEYVVLRHVDTSHFSFVFERCLAHAYAETVADLFLDKTSCHGSQGMEFVCEVGKMIRDVNRPVEFAVEGKDMIKVSEESRDL